MTFYALLSRSNRKLNFDLAQAFFKNMFKDTIEELKLL